MTWPQQPQQHGWQQPGFQQPPQQGWQPYPRQPPKKSKAPLIIAVVVGLVVIGGLVAGLVTYLNVNSDGGEPKRADQLPALCGNISEAALAKARTTNPNGLGSHEMDMPSDKGKRTICSWHQTKGVDGSGYRGVDVYVQTASEASMDEMVAQHMKAAGVPQQKPLDGLGDQATAVLVEGNSALTDIWILVRKGDTTVQVDYTGWDAGIFSNKKPDVVEFEAAAKGLAEEMVAKI
ncbi:hypothetical protein ABZX92_16430 [Lentzea sp. NPDC006480]|uniref:hypothetical protein n=1 Tax=Lentzea sp. NPDC006480 TaxID=3157176 RepID=UPI0033BB8974